MLDAGSAGKRERTSNSLPHPRAEYVANQRSSEHLTDQREVALPRKDSRQTFPGLRAVDDDRRLAKPAEAVCEISNNAGLVRRILRWSLGARESGRAVRLRTGLRH